MPQAEDPETTIQGYVRIPPENTSSWLPLLRDLYRFESERIAGPGSDGRRIEDVIWSIDDVVQEVHLNAHRQATLRELLVYLEDGRQLMRFPAHDDDPDRFITRVGELARMLGHTYEYWYRGRPGVSAVRWLVADKMVPKLTIPATQFRDTILENLEEWRGGDDGHNLREAARMVCEAVAKSIGGDDWEEEVRFSEFQLKCTQRILRSRYSENRSHDAQVLTAGVGAGKTIGFSIATLIEAVTTMLDAAATGNPNHRRTALLIYPRTQLAKDQHAELMKFARELDDDIKFEPFLEHHTAYKQRGDGPVTSGVEEHYNEEELAKPIIVTTYETLKRRMRRPEFMAKISKHISTVVLDEIHLTSGVAGGMASYLLSRLGTLTQSENRDIYWIGASATIARPDEHASRLFGIPEDRVGVIAPSDAEMEQAGINHHIFLRSNPGASSLGVLVNLTSLAVHHRRDDVGNRLDDDNARPKSIGFANNLELLGRWNDDLRENERTDHKWTGSQTKKKGRQHAEIPEVENWNQRQRELPYALRFHKPLQRRLCSKGGRPTGEPDDFLKDLSHLFPDDAANVCDRCMKGERVKLGEVSAEELLDMKKLVHRWPHNENDRWKSFNIDNAVFKQEGGATIGSHEQCPYLQAGACAWFPQPQIDVSEEIGLDGKRMRHEYRSVVRSTVFSSKSGGDEDDLEGEGDGLSSLIFRDKLRFVYGIGPHPKYTTETIPVDIVLSSPSLEVGVDIDMLTESVMTKAIRNIASYRQKAGRVGRERGLDIVNMTLLSRNSIDLHYYRQPRKLISEGRLEPVPLMDRNMAVVMCSAYGSIWEWLALNSTPPEWIKVSNGDGIISKNLRKCLTDLDKQRPELTEYVQKATKDKLRSKPEMVEEAIEQVEKEIRFLLLPAGGTYTVRKPEPSFAFTVADLFAMHRQKISLHSGGVPKIKKINVEDEYGRDSREDIQEQKDAITNRLRRLHPEVFAEECPEFLDYIYELQKQLVEKNVRILREVALGLKDVAGELAGISRSLEKLVEDVDELANAVEKIEGMGVDLRVESLFEDYEEMGDNQKNAYLSDVLDSLSLIKATKSRPWFLRPKTMFQNPYTKMVELIVRKPGAGAATQLNSSQREIPLSEALHSFQPGTWTHRIPHRKFKVMTGAVMPEDGRLRATIREMSEAGNRFVRISQKSLPPPPGVANKLTVWAPIQLSLLELNDKYVTLDRESMAIGDDDEQERRAGTVGDEEEYKNKEVRVPKSFQNRWSHSEPRRGSKIKTYRLDGHRYEIKELDEETEVLDDSETLVHPLMESLLDEIVWHDKLDVIEYSYSSSRSYSGAGEVELVYEDGNDKDVAFGDRFETEGITINVNSDAVKDTVEKIVADLRAGTPNTTPSLLKCFKAHVATDTENNGAGISPYGLDDLISISLIHNEWDGQALSSSKLVAMLNHSSDDLRGFSEEAERYLRRNMRLKQRNFEEDENPDVVDEKIINPRLEQLKTVLEWIQPICDGFEDSLGLWVHRTVLSTLGLSATSALRQFSGSDDEDVGYLIEPKSWSGDGTRVTLYDRSHFGNGSCATAKEYLHIPHVNRYGGSQESMRLPSTDYLSTLEEKLLQCMQHQSDMGALAIHQSGSVDAMKSMPDLRKHSMETKEIGEEIWGELGISGPGDAWSLPLHARLATKHDESNANIEADDLIRATTICWTGCPECVDDLKNTLGGMRGTLFIDKFVLDDWFIRGISSSDSYELYDMQEIADGTADLHLGSRNKLHLVSEEGNRNLCSLCLPWTMGFQISREDDNFNVKIVMRDSDISGLRMGEKEGVAQGIPSHGFRRLLWFDLLMTGHLESIGAWEANPEKKWIEMLYFDARDISFHDVGLSPRMLDSMMADGGSRHIENLSDVILWMLERGFKIKLCIDRGRAAEAGVLGLLRAIGEHENFSLMSMPVEETNMHQKILITPIAALDGSANLTYSGTQRNRESINHTMRRFRTGYRNIRANARETFDSAVPLDMENIEPRIYTRVGDTTESIDSEPMTELEKYCKQFEDGTFTDEGATVECKDAYCKPHTDPGRPNKNLTETDKVDIAHSEIASMVNHEGGFLFAGIENGTWEVVGIDNQIQWKNRGNSDLFTQYVIDRLCDAFGRQETSTFIIPKIVKIKGKSVLAIEVKKSGLIPLFMKPLGNKFKDKVRGNDAEKKMLWVRISDSARELETIDEILRFTNNFRQQ